VTHQLSEILTELYIRLETIIDKLEKLKPTSMEVYEDMFVSIFLNALPKDLTFTLQEAYLKKTLADNKNPLKYVTSHPNLHLTVAAVRKEVKLKVNAYSAAYFF